MEEEKLFKLCFLGCHETYAEGSHQSLLEDYGHRKDSITLYLPDIDSSNIKQIMTAGECRCVSGNFQSLDVLDKFNFGRLKFSSFSERERCSNYQK